MSECQWSLEVFDMSRMKSRGIHINLRRWEASRMWVRESTFDSIASTLKIPTHCMCSVDGRRLDGWSKMRKIHFVAENFTFLLRYFHTFIATICDVISRWNIIVELRNYREHMCSSSTKMPKDIQQQWRENEYKNNTRKIIFTEWMRTSKNKNSLIRLCTCMRSSRSSLTRCDLCDFIATATAVAYWKLRVRKPKIAGGIKWLKIDD